MLIDSIYADLQNKGFSLIRNFINDLSDLSILRYEALDLTNTLISSKSCTKRMRIHGFDGDLARIWGIENFLCDFTDNSLAILDKTQLLELVKYLLGDEIFLDLNRIHCQRSSYLHKLFWHRDSLEFGKAIIANIYLESESGFRLTDRANTNKIISKSGAYSSHNRQFMTINARAGDLLVFDGGLFHQPYNLKPRLHLHFAFSSVMVNPAKHINSFLDHNCACLNRNKILPYPMNNIKLKIKFLIQNLLDPIDRMIK